MRIFLFLLLFPLLALATPPWTYRVDTSSTNMAATFPAGPQLSGPSSGLASVSISNGSASEIEVNCSSNTKPSSLATDSVFVPPNSSYQSPSAGLVPNAFGSGKVCWLRSVSGAISSGIIEVVAYGY